MNLSLDKREREREREKKSRVSAGARVLWTAYWALVLLLSSVLGSVAGPCPRLVLDLTAPLNSVAGLCVRVLSSSCPCVGRAPEPCGWSLWPRLTGEECGRTNSDVNADKNSLMKQFALGVKVGRAKKSIFD